MSEMQSKQAFPDVSDFGNRFGEDLFSLLCLGDIQNEVCYTKVFQWEDMSTPIPDTSLHEVQCPEHFF